MAVGRQDRAAGGRPRDSARSDAILQSTLELLSELGYDRLSVEAVARRAGVAKTTIYRRWPDKARLITDAVSTRVVPAPVANLGTDLRSTARAVVTALAGQMAAYDISVLTALFSARRTDSALADLLATLLEQDGAAMAAPLAEAAQRQGLTLRTDFADVVAELVPALLLHRLLVLDNAIDDAAIAHLVDRLLLPLIVDG